MGSETPVVLCREAVEEALDFRGLSRSDLEQPMVFYRVGWDFRWLSRNAVIDRLCGGKAAASIVDDRRTAEDPPELDEFMAALGELVEQNGGAASTDRTASPNDEARDLAFGLGTELARQLRNDFGDRFPPEVDGAKRQVIVLPGGWDRTDTWAALRLAIEFGAAMVLPPAEGAWAWTVVWSRPTFLVAALDQLAALEEEISSLRRWKRKRVLRKLRWVGVVWSASWGTTMLSEGEPRAASPVECSEVEWLRSLGPKVCVANPNRSEPRKL